jgi:hypothetical protein
MKKLTYYLCMSDGKDLQIKANSASEAMQTALEQHRGHRVLSCYSGPPAGDGGRIQYEIPRHNPLIP